jgi:hypothetical protein
MRLVTSSFQPYSSVPSVASVLTGGWLPPTERRVAVAD